MSGEGFGEASLGSQNVLFLLYLIVIYGIHPKGYKNIFILYSAEMLAKMHQEVDRVFVV